jgi:hypothetical protein
MLYKNSATLLNSQIMKMQPTMDISNLPADHHDALGLMLLP